MIGTALTSNATKAMLLGCDELVKEVVIDLQCLGIKVIGVDRYANVPAMQVAHRSYNHQYARWCGVKACRRI